MECCICSRDFGERRHLTCTSCARTAVYGPRVEQLYSLLDKEKLHQTIKTVLQPPTQLRSSQFSSASQIVDLTEGARKIEIEAHRGHIRALDARVDAIKEQQVLLRQQIAEARKENAARKTEHAQRQQAVQVAKSKSHVGRDSQLVQVQTDCKRLTHRLEKVQKHTVQGRQKLCSETAVLSGLRRKKGRMRNGTTSSDTVSIGQMPIPDLRHLNTVHPDLINASLAHTTRLLATTSHYLGIRLPAEVVPPHAGSPQPGIFSLHSSYRHNTGKLRQLAIPKPLPLLAKEDTPTYNLFMDGLVLLAYDIAWLSRTQGGTSITSWEDLCAIGNNMYHLFLGEQENVNPDNTTGIQDIWPVLGNYSHANADVIKYQVSSLLNKWSLPPLARIQDKVKSHLLTEMSGAEWEVLDEKEWEEERDDERAVLVGGAKWSLAAGAASRMGVSYMTAAQDGDDAPNKEESGKGWMKLKVRSGEGKE